MSEEDGHSGQSRGQRQSLVEGDAHGQGALAHVSGQSEKPDDLSRPVLPRHAHDIRKSDVAASALSDVDPPDAGQQEPRRNRPQKIGER